MKKTDSAHFQHRNVDTITLAFALSLAPGMVRPYPAEAQSPLRGRRPPVGNYFPTEYAYDLNYYQGIVPPFISARSVSSDPRASLVPVPLYGAGGQYRDDQIGDGGAHPAVVTVSDGTAQNPALANAITEFADAWQKGNALPLSRHIDRDRAVAIFLKGQFKGTIESGAFLSIT